MLHVQSIRRFFRESELTCCSAVKGKGSVRSEIGKSKDLTSVVSSFVLLVLLALRRCHVGFANIEVG